MLGGVVPGLAALVAAWLLSMRRGGAWAALAIAIGYAAGQATLFKMDGFRPTELANWNVWFAIAGGVAGEVERRLNWRWLRWVMWLAICAAAPALLLRPIVEHEWEGTARWINLSLLSLGLLAMTVMLGSGQRVKDPVRPIVWVLVALGVAVLHKLTGSLKYSEMGGVTTACAVAITIVAIFRKDWAAASAAGGVFAVVIGSLLIVGVFYSSMPATYAGLVCVAMLMSSSVFPPRDWSRGRLVSGLLRIVVAAAALAGAIVPAAITFQEEWNSSGADLPY